VLRESANICVSSVFVFSCVERRFTTGDNQPKGSCQTSVDKIPKPEEMWKCENRRVWGSQEDKQHEQK
jgi:hypothetical protein